jgi:Mycoplasma protein of unknown function, DUF285
MVSSVEDMSEMVRGYAIQNHHGRSLSNAICNRVVLQFKGATTYNRAIHDWDVSGVVTFRSMFEDTNYNRVSVSLVLFSCALLAPLYKCLTFYILHWMTGRVSMASVEC